MPTGGADGERGSAAPLSALPCQYNEDIRTDIKTLSNYKLPYWQRRGKHLRNEVLPVEWRDLRTIACKSRFGRVELLPVKKSAQAVGLYLGDYLVKTCHAIAAGQRCRLIRFSQNINHAISSKFSAHTLGQLIYRTWLKMAARVLGFTDYGDFAENFGTRWNYYLRNTIAGIPMLKRFRKERLNLALRKRCCGITP